MWGLRAPPRRITVPQGANDDCNRGSSLKLKVVRRNRAGQQSRLRGAASANPEMTVGRSRVGHGSLDSRGGDSGARGTSYMLPGLQK